MTDDPNERLVQAVTTIDVDGVREALAGGADHGADPRPAMALAEARYGPWDPSLEGPFAEAWRVVARAAADTD